MSKLSKIFFKAAGVGGDIWNRYTGSVEAQKMRGEMYDEKRRKILRRREIRKSAKEKGY